MVRSGDRAPAFELFDQQGKVVRLSDFKGQWLLIYFYPKDNTPGCTKEACALRDEFPNFTRVRAAVVGVSADSVASHRAFADRFKLPFTLLSDPEKSMLKAYGVWQKKKFMGREYLGIVRSSFLIDPSGTVVNVYPKVNPLKHAQEVLTDLRALSAES